MAGVSVRVYTRMKLGLTARIQGGALQEGKAFSMALHKLINPDYEALSMKLVPLQLLSNRRESAAMDTWMVAWRSVDARIQSTLCCKAGACFDSRPKRSRTRGQRSVCCYRS